MGIFTFNNLLPAVKTNGLSESFLPPMILNMSITASVIILFVLLARLALKKAPKVFSYALWTVVLFRLLCPVSITTDFSLLGLFDTPAVENTQHTTAVEYIPYDAVHTPNLEVQLPVPPAINDAVNNTLPQEHAALGADPLEGEFAIGSMIWLLGIAVMAIYSAVSYILLRRKLVGSILLRDDIYLADGICSPFVMGFIRPKIYLPSALSEQEQSYIILHEQHHIRRGDHIIKALAFIALCIHWFNPLVWIAFVLSSKDMEMSCDEAVVKKLGEGIRADYSASLLSLATGRRIIAGTPLAFGEGDTKSRIKNMLNWNKPKTWIVLVSLLTCVVAIVFCAANPRNDVPEEDSMVVWELDQKYPDAVVDIVDDYIMQQVEYYNSLGSGENAIGGEYSILEAKVINLSKMVATGLADTKQSVELYRLEYRLRPSEPDHVVLAGGMQMEDGWITEWGSTGQPYLALLCDWSSGEEIWTKIGLTNTDVIDHEYSTAEMLEQYHDKYAAAAMELYEAYLRSEAQTSYGTAEDVSYYLELAAGETFQDMSLEKRVSLLVEYEDLLDNYTLIARETEDGKTAYIVGQYNGNPSESPLYGMYGVEVTSADGEDLIQFLYREEESETVNAVLEANKTEFPPSAGYSLEQSSILWREDSGVVLILPRGNKLSLNVAWNRYLYTPNGREYIADAVSRGIDVCGRTDTFLYVYLISERFGEIAERIALTEAESQAILAEEKVKITDGFGFSASLHIDGQTTYYNEWEGIPQTVLDLAVEKCDYRFGDPSYITDTIREARLDCDWLDTALYADEADLPRLREILKNAEHGYVGACGYGAKLTLTFTGGEKLTVFKGCDGCDTIVFGSYGGYFLGEKENIVFWEMFGLDPDTKERMETNPADTEAATVFSIGDLLLEVTGVQSTRRETMLAEGVEPHEYSVFTYSPGATITVKNAGMRDGSYYEDGQAHAVWGLSYTGERTRTRITNETGVIAITPKLEGVYDLESSLFVLKFEATTQGPPEEVSAPAASPTEVDIHNAIMANNSWSDSESALYPYRAEAHHIWGTKQNGNRCTVYALGYRTTYEWGNGQPKRIYPEQVGSMELVFEWDGKWKLTSFWAPSENEDSISVIRNRFPSDIAAIVLGEVNADVLAALNAQCHNAALQYYATLTDLPPAKTFTPEDVNFSGKLLTSTPDEMTYEERLARVQAGPDYQQFHFTPLGQYAEGNGCIAYLGQWVGTPHMNQYMLDIRFADGTTAHLPLPDDGGRGVVPPDTIAFQNNSFIYEMTFPSQEVTNEGETLVHIKGTYHYEVDLAAKTVSLTVLQ